MKFIGLVISLAVFSIAAGGQEPDILDRAEKAPLKTQVRATDGTLRTPKYGDYQLEEAALFLKMYPRPFTVPRVIAWYVNAKDDETKSHLLCVLAASRDPRAALVLGNALELSGHVRWAAVYGLQDYFVLYVVSGGSENTSLNVEKWWKENRSRLEKEAAALSPKSRAFRV